MEKFMFEKLRQDAKMKVNEKYNNDNPKTDMERELLIKKVTLKESIDIFIDILEEYDKHR